MAFTKVRGRGVTTTDNYTVGVITATKFVGPITGGGGGINVGVLTATELDVNGSGNISGNLVVEGNLTANGDFTTLNTTLREVELLKVNANSSTTAGIITQTGAGDILNLFDGTTEVLTVTDGGKVGIGTEVPDEFLHLGQVGTNGNNYNEGRLKIGGFQGTDKGLLIGYDNRGSGRGNIVNANNSGGAANRINIGFGAITASGAPTTEVVTINQSGNVGIGSAIPDHKLDVAGTVHGTLLSSSQTSTGVILKLARTGTANGEYGFKLLNDAGNDCSLNLRDEKDNKTRISISSGGNIGINNSTAKYALHFKNAMSSSPSWIHMEVTGDNTAGGGGGIAFDTSASNDASNNSLFLATIKGIRNSLGNGSNDIVFSTSTNGVSGDDGNTSTPKEKVRITNDGKVGIGLTNPSSTSILHLRTSANHNLEFEESSGNLRISALNDARDTNEVLQFAASEFNFLTGNVGIATVTPNATLDIHGANSNAMLRLTESAYTNTNKYTKIFEYGGNTYFSTRNDTNAGSFIFRGETASATPEYLRMDPSGRLLVGHTATVDTSTYNSKIQVMADDAEASITVGRFGNNASASSMHLTKSRAADVASHTDGELHDNDVIGNIFWWGSDGGDYEEVAHIGAETEALFTGSSTPGALTFHTTSVNATSATEKLRITSTGTFGFNTSTIREQLHSHKTDSTENYLRFTNTSTGTAAGDGFNIGINSAEQPLIWNKEYTDMLFGTHGATRLTISKDGKATFTEEIATPQDYPNYRSTIDFNFAGVKKLDPRITYVRTGPASYIDERGKVVLIGANVPRFDHDIDTKESKGLLIEPSRTNLIPNSFDTESAWNSGSNGTLTRNAGIAPDGTNTATKASTTSNDIDTSPQLGNASAGATGQIAISGSTTYTLSVWAKASTTSQVGNNFKVRWKRVQGDGVFTETTFALTADWKRYSTTATTAANNTTVACYVGGVANSEALVWGAQFEAGSFATSLIPTYGTSATRGEDEVIIEGKEFTDFFNPIEGTSVVHAHMPNSSGNSGLPSYAFKNSAVSQHTLQFSRDGNSNPVYHYYHDGSNTAFTRASATADNMYKGAMSFKTGDLDSYVNGTANANTTSFTMPAFDYLRIGGVGGANQLGGHVARFMYYPVKLTNSQLITLTS